MKIYLIAMTIFLVFGSSAFLFAAPQFSPKKPEVNHMPRKKPASQKGGVVAPQIKPVPKPIAKLVKPFILPEGNTIVKRGIFLPGCEYGPLASLSDHAPVLWENDRVGTWNITSRVSHQAVTVGNQKFMGHKFKTDDKGGLIDDKSQPVIKGHFSEADVLSKTTVTNQYYLVRLKRIAKEIKKLFSEHEIDALAIQEIPYQGQRDVDGNDIQAEFAEALGPELKTLFPLSTATAKKTGLDGDKPLDVALVVKRSNRMKLVRPDLKNRMQPFCDWQTKECVASVHLPYADSQDAQMESCEILVSHVQQLFKRGFTTIKILGDFNASAVKIFRACKEISGFTPIIKVSPQKPQSCATNDGMPSPVTIDLLFVFTK